MIDLHIHSNHSDGYYTVKEILKMAEEENINTISFCDHNVLGAYEEHKAGEIVVLPHVFEYKSIDNTHFLNEMHKLNILDGIECIHSKHNKEQANFLINFCKQNNLIMSGGSDFHTDKRQTLGHTELGEILDKFCLKK